VLTPSQAEAYRLVALEKRRRVKVTVLNDAGHFDMLSPATASGAQVTEIILSAAGMSRTKP